MIGRGRNSCIITLLKMEKNSRKIWQKRKKEMCDKPEEEKTNIP